MSDISDVLRYLLKVSLAFGVENAVLAFNQDSNPEGNYRNYQSITSLEGITIETEIQICKGIRLVPIPSDIVFQLNHNLQRYHKRNRDKGVTLQIIERLRYSLFHKPSETTYKNGQMDERSFQVEANDIKLSNQEVIMEFRETFCQVLSLACNTMVMFDYFWDYSAADVFRSDDVEQKIWYLGPIGRKVEVGKTEIEEAKQMYKILENLDQRTKKIFWIASERWRKSKTHQNTQDTIIDLAIAFEALYLSKGNRDQLSLSFRLRAAWFLGDKKEDRKRIFTLLKGLYDTRSKLVHGGEFDKETFTIDDETVSMQELITEAQDLCQESIVKLLKKYGEIGKSPDDKFWNDLILGENDSKT